MDPTNNFYTTKRTLLIFAGALLLAVFAGFKLSNGDQRPSFLPFQLERPELLGTILFVAVFFYLFQFSLQWAAQSADIQNNRFHKIDFVATTTIGSLALLSFLGSLILPKLNEIAPITTLKSIDDILKIASTGLAVAVASSVALRRISATLGRWIKGKEAREDQKLIELLTSKEWMLHFNPQNIGARKKIVFTEDGQISIGRNNNESSWRVRNGLLEILDSEGRVYSRFAYDHASSKFSHTNDKDTRSIRFQYIFRAPRPKGQ